MTIQSATAPRRVFAATVAAAGLVALVALPGASRSAAAADTAPAPRVIPPAATHCTNPAHATEPANSAGLQPAQLRAAYGLTSLWQQGYRGQGEKVAILLFGGETLDAAKWQQYADCWGPFKTPVQQVVIKGNGPINPGGEGIFDPKSVVAAAPEAQIYELVATGGQQGSSWPTLIEAALDPANTGGSLVDVITTSFSHCEGTWDPATVLAVESALQKAARLGVKVFADAGDGGSAGLDTTTGKCMDWPVDVSAPPLGVVPGVAMPAASPYVTAIGGTELAINGTIPSTGSPRGGTITDEVVWNEEASGKPGWRFAGGGGASEFFTVADAPWQQQVGVRGAEGVPDLAALAGSPDYTDGGIGTSGATPFTAGAFAVVDGYLKAKGAKPIPTPLNPVLYKLAGDPDTYSTVFNDVVQGSNDLLGLGCCDAAVGYDKASGLGSINFAALAAAMFPPTPTPTTSPTASPTATKAPARPTTTARATPTRGKQLAATGSGGITPALGVGIGLLLLGAVGWLFGARSPRRR